MSDAATSITMETVQRVLASLALPNPQVLRAVGRESWVKRYHGYPAKLEGRDIAVLVSRKLTAADLGTLDEDAAKAFVIVFAKHKDIWKQIFPVSSS